jgi:RNA polymerase sigma-54 factor
LLSEFEEPSDRLIASFLTDVIEPSGWISCELSNVAFDAGCNEEEVLKVLKKVQGFEPAGVYARGLVECLEIQLRELKKLDEPMKKLLENLNLLAKGELKQLMRITGLNQEGISKSISLIRSLNPKPGESFEYDESYRNAPDVIVSKGSNGWVVELNKSTLPSITINEQYINEMSKSIRDESSTNFVSEAVASARWLKRSVEQRNSTTLTIAAAIVAQQEDFLELGLSHLKPMVLRDIATNVGMHESTVSRVTNSKIILTEWGLMPLKNFFRT